MKNYGSESIRNVALLGHGGCGKTTFINLLMRFYDVEAFLQGILFLTTIRWKSKKVFQSIQHWFP